MVEYAGDNLLAISICFAILNTIFILCRLGCRAFLQSKRMGWDDGLLALGYVFAMGMTGIGFSFLKYANVGYHTPDAIDRDPKNMVYWSQLVFALEYVYFTAVTLPKLSILLLLIQIFPAKPYRQILWVLMVLVIMYWIAFILATSLQCIPPEAAWDKSKPGKCYDAEFFFKCVNFPAAVIDIPILVTPMVATWRLHASRARKIGLTIIFTCGSLGFVACVARWVLFLQRSAYVDPTYTSVYLVGMSVIEPGLYLIAACLISMKPLAQYIFAHAVPPSWKSSIRSLILNETPPNQVVEIASRAPTESGEFRQESLQHGLPLSDLSEAHLAKSTATAQPVREYI